VYSFRVNKKINDMAMRAAKRKSIGGVNIFNTKIETPKDISKTSSGFIITN
jgi:hypothetical protein